MARNYRIATEFTIVDRATNALNNMTAAGSGIGGAWRRGVGQAQMSLDKLGQSVKTMGKWAVGIGAGAVGAGIAVATKQYAEFDSAIRAAGASYGPAFSQAADFEDKISAMGKAVRDVAAATEFDAVQSANAMKTLAQAGVQSEQAIALLPGVADLATAAMTSMDDAVGLAVGALNTMGMMSSVPEELAANMSRVSDVMAHTANSAKMSLQDVGAAITAGGSFFKTANNNLDILSGSLTALAGHSIAGAEAGTALRNIMTNLSAPTAKAEKALAKMNIQTTDAAGNLLPLPEIIGQFNAAMVNMGDAEKNANIYEIFGKQNIAAVTALLDTGKLALEGYAQAATNSTGTVVANAEAMRGSLSNKFKVLLSALTELGFKFVDAFAVQGGDALALITQAVNEFNPKPIIDALATTVKIVANLIRVVWKLRGVIAVVLGAFAIWKTSMMAAAVATKAYAIIVGIITKAKTIYTAALHAATVAQATFNAVAESNPIGLIVIAIAAAIAALVLLVIHWDKVSAAVDGFFERLHNLTGVGGIIVRAVLMPLDMLWTLFSNLTAIFDAFSNGGFINGIKMLGLTIIESLAKPLQLVLEILSHIPGIGDSIGNFNAEIDKWIKATKADLTAGQTTVDYGVTNQAGYHPYIPVPTRTAAAANSYSKEETVNTSRIQLGLEDGLRMKAGSTVAPGVTVNRGGSSGSW